MQTPVEGFSKFTKEEKIDWVANNYTAHPEETKKLLSTYWNSDAKLQQLHDEFIENSLSNYYLPFAVAPNFLVNNKLYALPMVIEESSVVAAASKSAKFWLNKGGFKTTVLNTEKVGQVHFMYYGDSKKLQAFFKEVKPRFFEEAKSITKSMEKRGGGINDIELRDISDKLSGYYQLHCTFETVDAMGANFINSCLEQFAKTLQNQAHSFSLFSDKEKEIEVVMSILSNYVPNCLVKAEVSCPITDKASPTSVSMQFAKMLLQAVNIAKVETYRAVTHNKGCLLYTSPSPRDQRGSRMPSSA